MGFTKSCWRCGRWGNHQFIASGKSDAVGLWECANDRACNTRRQARGLDGGRLVIHRAAPGPIGNARWFIDPEHVRYWLLDNGPGWGWEVVDDKGRQVADGFLTLDEVRQWATSSISTTDTEGKSA